MAVRGLGFLRVAMYLSWLTDNAGDAVAALPGACLHAAASREHAARPSRRNGATATLIALRQL